MKELINITEVNQTKVVSARELHLFLEVETQFRTWIERMFEYGFVENQDFTRANIYVRGNEAKDYALKLDCAKEISMIQRNEKGKQARHYFIEVEKKAKTQTPLEMLKIAVSELEQKEIQIKLQEKQLQISAPKVEYFEKVLQSESTYTTTLIAKELGMSAAALNKILCDNKVQYKQSDTWVLYSKFQDKDFTKTKTSTFTDADGKTRTYMLTVWTELGRKKIHEFIAKLNAKKSA
jgi:anti-repressor protein